jgi:general secretion pathway protein I
MTNRSRQSFRAFTLVEVLVSLAIFALAAVALSAAYLNVLNGYHARDQQRTIEQGWDLARVTVFSESDREKLEQGGSLNLPDGSSLNWEVRIEPSNLADLFALEMSVTNRGKDPWSKTGRLMLLRPAWSDPSERDRQRQASTQRLERLRTR